MKRICLVLVMLLAFVAICFSVLFFLKLNYHKTELLKLTRSKMNLTSTFIDQLEHHKSWLIRLGVLEVVEFKFNPAVSELEFQKILNSLENEFGHCNSSFILAEGPLGKDNLISGVVIWVSKADAFEIRKRLSERDNIVLIGE